MINLCLDVGTLLSPDEIYFSCYRAYDNDDWGFHDDNQIAYKEEDNTSCYDYYTFQDLEEACIRAKTLSLTEFPVSLLYEPIETEDGWRMKEIFIYMKGRAIASERIRLHCSFYLRAGHKLN